MIVEVITLGSILVVAYMTKKSHDQTTEAKESYEQGMWALNQKILANKGAINALQFHAERTNPKSELAAPKKKRGRPRKTAPKVHQLGE